MSGLNAIFIDPTALPQNFGGFVQVVFLLLAYGFVLFNASNMISDGSELLLLVPSVAGIVGSIVLPVLGAVPDGAIVLFSGLGPDAQTQLSVGVGALAGSTIMLLTVPWFASLIAGRVTLDKDGQGTYKRPAGAPKDWSKVTPPGFHPFSQGINCRSSIKTGGKIMMLTSISYLLIQGPTFGLNCDKGTHCSSERWWAFAGMLLCLGFFVWYLWWQAHSSDSETNQELVDKARQKAIENSLVSFSGVFAAELTRAADKSGSNPSVPANERLRTLLKNFFVKYDRDASGSIDKNELVLLLSDMNEVMSKDQLDAFMARLDTDNDGSINFDEFYAGMTKLILEHAAETGKRFMRNDEEASERTPLKTAKAEPASSGNSINLRAEGGEGAEGEGEAAEDEEADSDGEEEVPDDLQNLTPAQQQTRIKLRSAWMMGLGTALILLFSDPMVDVLSDFGNRIGVSPFYVGFVLAPIASNASELIASVNYAAKKTKKTITISLEAVQGAACMNNTFVLGIFLLLIFAKNLIWVFSAETLSILLVQIIMAIVSQKTTHSVFSGFGVIMLYPLSLAFVAVLENVVGLN